MIYLTIITSFKITFTCIVRRYLTCSSAFAFANYVKNWYCRCVLLWFQASIVAIWITTVLHRNSTASGTILGSFSMVNMFSCHIFLTRINKDFMKYIATFRFKYKHWFPVGIDRVFFISLWLFRVLLGNSTAIGTSMAGSYWFSNHIFY